MNKNWKEGYSKQKATQDIVPDQDTYCVPYCYLEYRTEKYLSLGRKFCLTINVVKLGEADPQWLQPEQWLIYNEFINETFDGTLEEAKTKAEELLDLHVKHIEEVLSLYHNQ